MQYSKQIKPLSYVKAHASEILEDIDETRNAVIITVNGEAKAVLQDVKSYEETQETLALLKVLALGEKEFAEGKFSSAREAMGRIRTKLKS
jgi:prevent-host-death family protein